LQENERMSTGPGVARPDRPLPTTLEVEFPLQRNGTTQRTAAATTASRVERTVAGGGERPGFFVQVGKRALFAQGQWQRVGVRLARCAQPIVGGAGEGGHQFGVEQGSVVGVKFDPMLAKLICHAPDRNACIDRLARALRDYVILGTKTNVSWLRRVVTHEAFRDGRVSTRFLTDHELPREVPEVVASIAEALVARAPRSAATRAGITSVWDAVSFRA